MTSFRRRDGFWTLRFAAELRAPDATFDRDLPLMLAIAKSWRGDDAAIARRINGQTVTNQRRFEASQRQQRENSAAFDRYNARAVQRAVQGGVHHRRPVGLYAHGFTPVAPTYFGASRAGPVHGRKPTVLAPAHAAGVNGG